MSENLNGRPTGGRFGLGELLLCITLSLCWFLALRPAVDPDYGWHIANGRHVLDGSAFGGRDLYSWTASGLWVVHEWLVEAGMAIVHDRFGPAGNSILAATLWTSAFGLVAIRLRSRGFGWGAAVSTVFVGFLCTMMSAGVRPQVLELVYLSFLLLMVDRVATGRARKVSFLAGVAVLAIVWVNSHGSFPLLAVVLVLWAIGSAFDRAGNAGVYLVAALIASIVFLANPWGYHILTFAAQSMQSAPTLSSIDEWKAPRLATGSLIPFDLAALLASFSAIMLAARRARGHARARASTDPTASDVLIFLAMFYIGLRSGRHVMLLGIGAAPLVADALGRIGARLVRHHSTIQDASVVDDGWKSKRVVNGLAASLVVLAVISAGWKTVSPEAQERAIAERYPVSLVPQLRSLVLSPGLLLNEYAWGGFLISQGVTPVFIDGRSELYGDDQLVRYGRIVRLSSGWRQSLDSLAVQVAVLRGDSRLASALETSGWRVVGRDSVAVILQRR